MTEKSIFLRKLDNTKRKNLILLHRKYSLNSMFHPKCHHHYKYGRHCLKTNEQLKKDIKVALKKRKEPTFKSLNEKF